LQWSDLAPVWQRVLELSWEAWLEGCVPIGAVIVDRHGNLVASGRNRISIDHAPEGQICGSKLAHAEMNALLALPKDVDPHELAIHSAVEPCPLCMGAIYMAGVRQIHFAARDAYAGSTNLLGATPYLSRKPVKAHPPHDPILEAAVTALHTEFCLRRSAETRVLVELWRIDSPTGVALGERLLSQDFFKVACAARPDAVTAWNSLFALL